MSHGGGGRRPFSNPGNGAGRGPGVSHHRSHSQLAQDADSGGTEPLLGDEGSSTKRTQPGSGRNGLFWKLSVVAAVVLIGFVISQQVSSQQIASSLERGLDYMKEHRGPMVPAFFLFNIVIVLVCCPGAIPQMLAGAIYGILGGATLAYTGTLTGQVIAFMLGRHLFRESLSVWMVRRFPSWPAVETAIFRPQGGRWGAVKMLLLLRLSPAMPDSLMSYALALTSVHFPLYAGISALALVPYCSIGAYMGSVSSDIIKSITGGGSGGDAPKSGNVLKITFTVVSIAMFIAMAMYVGAVLRKAVAQATVANSSSGDSSGSGTSSGSASDDEDQSVVEKRPLIGGAQITLTESGSAVRGQHALAYSGGGADGEV